MPPHRTTYLEPATDNAVDILNRYIETSAIKKTDLARVARVTPAHLRHLRNKTRSLAELEPEGVLALLDALSIVGEDRTAIEAGTRLRDLPLSPTSPASEGEDPDSEERIARHLQLLVGRSRRWHDVLKPAIGLLLGRALGQPRALAYWAAGRTLDLRCDVRRALPLLQRAGNDAREFSDRLGGDEVSGIILLDVADVYAVAGNLGTRETDAPYYARLSENTIAGLLKSGMHDEMTRKRLCMGVARAIILQQHIQYQRGCEEQCWRLYCRALPYLDEAGDFYGRAKSQYFLALMLFHQGDFVSAQFFAEQAKESAYESETRMPWYDLLWSIRDGIYFGKTWWQVHTLTLLLDILAAQGKLDAEFERLFGQHLDEKPWWARDFPPFSPRYIWVAEWRDQDLDWVTRMRSRLEARIRQTIASQYIIYLPDLLLSYGDFLQAIGQPSEAQRQYSEALRAAQQYRSAFLADAATRRLSGADPLPVLARLRRGPLRAA